MAYDYLCRYLLSSRSFASQHNGHEILDASLFEMLRSMKTALGDSPQESLTLIFKGAGQSFFFSQDGSTIKLALPTKPIDGDNPVIHVGLESPSPLG